MAVIRSRPLLLAAFAGPAAVALFTPAWSLIMLAYPLVHTLGPQLYPVATGFHVSGSKTQLRDLLIRSTRYTFLMGVPAYLILGLFAHPILHVWLGRSLGPDYAITANALIFLSIYGLFHAAQGSNRAVLIGMNRVRFMVVVQVIGAVFSVTSAVLLLVYTNLGPLAVVIPQAIEDAVVWPVLTWYTAKGVDLSYRRHFARCYVRSLIVLAILAPLALLLVRGVRPAGVLSLVGCMLLVGLAWVPLCWWVGLGPEDRSSFRQLLSRAKGRLFRRKGGRADQASALSDGKEVSELVAAETVPTDTNEML
jgi:O-antigen/teichoic acid export membrane protein